MQLSRIVPKQPKRRSAELVVKRMNRDMRLRKPFAGLLGGRVVAAACTPHHVDQYLSLFEPTWSLRDVRARIVGVQKEYGDAVSIFLVPNENFRGFAPGQYVRLSVTVDGVRHTRCFSISSAPHEPTLRITIKQQPGGKVSTWACARAQVGQVIDLSQAMGDFTLSASTPKRLLFIAGGSGITPFRSLVLHLLHANHDVDVTCLHFSRGEGTFSHELNALCVNNANFHYVPFSSASRERLTAATIELHAKHWRESDVYVCGPQSLESAACNLMKEHDHQGQLHVERFVAAVPPPNLHAATSAGHALQFARAGRVVATGVRRTLLEEAEYAGLKPAFGCRMGVCHTCKCTKVSGAVRNELTGVVSSEPEEEIRLCVSTAHSDVIIDL